MYQRVPVPNGLLLFHLDSHPKQLLLLLWQQPSMQRTAALGVQPGAQRQSSFHVICGHLAPIMAGWLSSSPNCQAEAPGQNIAFPRVYSIILRKKHPDLQKKIAAHNIRK